MKANAAARTNSMLREVLDRIFMRMTSILQHNLWGAVTERFCDAAAAEDFILASVHFVYNLDDVGTQAWIFPAFSAILREGR